MKSMSQFGRMIFVGFSFMVLLLSGCGDGSNSTPSATFTSGNVAGKTFTYASSTDSTGIFTFNTDNTWSIHIDELDLSGDWSINEAGKLVCVTTNGGGFTLTYTLISTTENTFDTDVEQVDPADPDNPYNYTATLTAVLTSGQVSGKTFDYVSSTGSTGIFTFNSDSTWEIDIDELVLNGDWSINEEGKLVCVTTSGGDFTLTYTALVSADANAIHASVVQLNPADPGNQVNYTATFTPSNNKVIQVGAILPLDGAWASVGQNAKVALDIAVESVNYYLKKDSLQLELVVENSSSDAGMALDALESLHAKGVNAVVGPMTSDEAAAIVGYANANNILLVSPSSTAAALALPDNLFRMVPNDKNQVEALADLMTKQNITRLLPVYLNDTYGLDFEQLMRTQVGNDIEVLDPVKYEVGVTDFTPVVSSLTAIADGLEPDNTGILFIGRDFDAVQIFSSAGISSRLANFKWYATDSVIGSPLILESEEAASFADKVELEGFTFSYEATAPASPTMMITGMMSAKLDASPAPSTIGVWDALWFLAESYRLNPDADTDGLIESFESVVNIGGNFLSQATKLDANGDMVPVRYARFAMEKDGLAARWDLKALFIKSTSAGTLILPATASPTQETGDAVIGVLLPLSGSNAESGSGAQQAINLALKHAGDYYNKAMGLNINLTVEVRDTESDPGHALVQLKALQSLGIKLFIGPINSGELAGVREYAQENGIVIINSNSTATSLSRSDDRIMRLTPDDSNQAKAMSRLITAQNKQNVVLIYRNDVYGQDFLKAFSEIFMGTIDSYSYEPDATNFTPVLDDAAAKLEAIAAPTNTAILVIGLEEITSLLEQVNQESLTEVKWYGTDGISKSRKLLKSPAAVAVATKTQLTCSVYDSEALPFFAPPIHVLESELNPLLGGFLTWNEISVYDALWIGASAFSMTSPAATSEELWTYLSSLYANTGISGIYLFNENSDQTVTLYGFFAVEESDISPVWKAKAFYRDSYYLRDDLEILGQ